MFNMKPSQTHKTLMIRLLKKGVLPTAIRLTPFFLKLSEQDFEILLYNTLQNNLKWKKQKKS